MRHAVAIRAFTLLLGISLTSCEQSDSFQETPVQFANFNETHKAGKGAVLLQRIGSLEEFERLVQVEHLRPTRQWGRKYRGAPTVRLVHESSGKSITSILTTGVSEADFIKARDGSIFDKLGVALRCPYAVRERGNIIRVEILSRRRYEMFGEGDIAFYDLAESMVANISDMDASAMTEEDLGEKGYLNTFNHITAQAFVTSMFSERLADFIADVHERYRMPNMITGHFTEEQIADLDNGAVDNYVDVVNNEWGQELGKVLKARYDLNRNTIWTPRLLTFYLNDIQAYHSWSFGIRFEPFAEDDELVVRFADKINTLRHNVFALVRQHY